MVFCIYMIIKIKLLSDVMPDINVVCKSASLPSFNSGLETLGQLCTFGQEMISLLTALNVGMLLLPLPSSVCV